MPIISQPIVESENPRILLCEGYDEGLLVESAYVRQGDKVWSAFGSSDSVQSLCESEQVKLVESFDDLEVVTESDGTKRVPNAQWIVEGPAQRSDVKNKNGRVYPRAIWEKWIADDKSPLQENIKNRAALGHLEHPKDGRTDGREGALLVTEASLRKDGVVWGKFEILDTPNGRILQEYTRKKVRWGVSSRGAGSVNESGIINIKDYVPETWDGVMRPSTPGAFPTTSAPVKNKKTVQEDDSSAGSSADVQKAFASRLDAINRAVDTIDECVATTTAAETLLRDITESLSAGGDAVVLAPILLETATVLRESFDALAAMQVIEHAGAGVRGDDKAFDTLVAMLKKQVADSVSESAELRAKVEEQEGLIEKYVEARMAQADKLDEQTTLVGQLQKQVEEACATIAELSESTPPPNPVHVLVEALTSNYSHLVEYAEPLRGLSSANEVFEEIMPHLIRECRKRDIAPVSACPVVPAGVILESVGSIPTPTPTAVNPEIRQQIGLAAAVIGMR